jgi:hypothetical protein
MKKDYVKLEAVIALLGEHSTMLSSIILAERVDRYNQIIPARYLTDEDTKPFRDARKLLIEIRNNERKREQDEHAIAFAKTQQN